METVIAIEAPPPPNVRNYRVSTAVKKRKLIDGMEPVDPRRNSIVSATSAASPLARPAGKIHGRDRNG